VARAIWKGSISFGLVNIPIELHTAVRDTRPHFRMLHAKDKSPVRFQRVCISDGHPVAWEDLVKGFEYAKGRFVVLSKEDFSAAAVEKTRTVDILDFVGRDEIDDRYFDTPYYVTPSKGGERAYALLREAIRDTERVGIAKFILREAQHLAAVEVIDDAIVLSVMRFADELVDRESLTFPPASGIRAAELDMAKALVNSLAAEWDPSKYSDEYRANLLRIIEAKTKGKTVTLEASDEPRQAEVIDLMERLKRSLDQAGGGRPTGERAAKTKAKPAAKRAKAAKSAKDAKGARKRRAA
jgi:DNA end-binding protein Ku